MKTYQNMVERKIKKQCILTPNEIEQQFDICCLYCAFAFKKEGEFKGSSKTNFGNRHLRRDVINVKNWL